jgi:nitroimidazol reductase NimA-like FMN-containing flavoprotein (pyridoxamine 5'-phosphate oxidase superfamily)
MMTPRTPSFRGSADATSSGAQHDAPATKAHGAPRFSVMSPASCLSLLRRHAVGRMAFSFHDRVDIAPIHYVHSDGWLFARTSHGAKMTTLQHSPWVAFEVDEIDGVFDWRSVVVHGTAYTMERDGGPTEAQLWSRGISLLRRIVPETGTDDDPVAYRTLVFGIYVDTITGRKSSSRT